MKPEDEPWRLVTDKAEADRLPGGASIMVIDPLTPEEIERLRKQRAAKEE